MNRSLQRSIFSANAWLLLCAVCVLTVMLSALFYAALRAEKWVELHRGIDFVVPFVETLDDTSIGNQGQIGLPADGDLRITLIDASGHVLLDTRAEEGALDSHAGREEFREAQRDAYGQAVRVSKSIGTESLYVARRLSDGRVLRVSGESQSIVGVFLRAVPLAVLAMVLVLLPSLWASKRLVRRIVEPIWRVSHSEKPAETYEEIAPLIAAIQAAKEKTEQQYAKLVANTRATYALLQRLGEGVALLDPQGLVLFINDSARRLLSIGDAHVEGKRMLEITRQLHIHEGVKRALGGESHEWMDTHGQETTQLCFFPVEAYGAMVLWLDATSRMQAERMRVEFTGNVSHELKTPLTAISARAEMLGAGMVAQEDQAAFIQSIRDESARMLLLIDDLLLLSRLHEMGDALAVQAFSLCDMMARIVNDMQKKIEEKGLDVSISCDASLLLVANQRMMEEMLRNLVENAIKYNRQKGSVHLEAIRTQETSDVEIIVQDTGIGIPKEHQARVFERFYRVDQSRSRKTGGTGLGLSIVRHIAEVHGGRVTLTSGAQGTTVRALIPQ